MSESEVISILVAVIAVVLSMVSLVRTRNNTKIQLELEKISANLAAKQLAKLEETEDRDGQPVFIVRVVNIFGSHPDKTGYKAKIIIDIQNSGEGYLAPMYVSLVTLVNGEWRLCDNALLDQIDIREHDQIIGKRAIILKPGSKLQDCTINIIYMDNSGKEQIQVYDIFPEGGFSDRMPHNVHFSFKKIYNVVPGQLWEG